MKVRCDACERAEAAVLCCADEAALCRRCDAAVHSANKLAGKHQRVALLPAPRAHPPPPDEYGSLPTSWPVSSSPSSHPLCDICQEKRGYFFCLEDRALLCRSCDVDVHMASPLVSSHKRFLITGVRIGGALQEHIPSNGGGNSAKGISPSSSGNGSNLMNEHEQLAGAVAARFREELGQQWPWNEVFHSISLEQCYGLSEPGSSTLTG